MKNVLFFKIVPSTPDSAQESIFISERARFSDMVQKLFWSLGGRTHGSLFSEGTSLGIAS
jgi:hypothetical protein